MKHSGTIFYRVWRFYLEGFRAMTWGRTLWWLILIKLIVFFVILKFIFFPDFLDSRTDGSSHKSEYVGRELVERALK